MTTKFSLSRRDFLKLGKASVLYYALYSLFLNSHYERSTTVKTEKSAKDLQHFYYHLSEDSLKVFNDALNEARSKGCLLARSIEQIDEHTFVIKTTWNSRKDFINTYGTEKIISEIRHLKTRGIHFKDLDVA